MSDISGQLIKNSYNYVLQSDIISGIVYRIGGDVPTNPKFISGLTVNTVFTYSNGTEVDGYVLTCDASGNASWGPVSGTTPSSGVTSVTVINGLSGNVTTGAITLVNTAPDQIVTITGGTNIQILGTYPDFGVNFTGTTGSNFTGGTVSGATNFTNGLTANTISATTYYNYPDTYVTAFTYNNSNILTIEQNNSQPTLSLLINQVTGWTSTGNVNISGNTNVNGYVQFYTASTATSNVARLTWNDTDGTLDLGLKGGNVTLQIGQEQMVRVVNKIGSNLLESNYQAVRISGAQGNRIKVNLAQANNDANSSETIGLVTENINNNQEGFITISGLVRGINTTGSLQSESWTDGDILYLSSTIAGSLTNIKPVAPQHTVTMGYVVQSNPSNGSIFVKVDSGYELDELHNVSISSATDGQVLAYSASTQLWVPISLNLSNKYDKSGGTITGNAIVQSGLTANTISATTYYNLPISAVTNGTGISASTSNGTVTIINTAPDQTVLISGGSNIQITGAYPSFGVNFTGNTSSTGDYLPLSGGTVTGGTTFQSGLTANTISATTYYNYPDTYVTGFSLTNDAIILSQNRTDSYSSFTVTLSGLTGTPQQISYYNADGNLTGDTSFTRQDETNNYQTYIGTINSLNVNEYQQSSYDYYRVRSRVFNDDISLVGVTILESQSFISTISDNAHNTVSGLEILEASGSFTYQDSGGTYCGFFYNSTNPGWSVVKSVTQYDYNLPQSAYLAGGVLTDVSGDGNLTWVIPTSSTFTGGTVSGATRFISGLTANTISATTYQNLPATPFLPLSGGTVSGFVRVQPAPATNQKALFSVSENSSESIALYGIAGQGTNAYGVYCDISPTDEFYTITNGIGGYFEVGSQFSHGEPTNKYSLQLKDGTQGVGKVLTSVTSDGKANWSNTINVSAVTATTITSNSVKVLPVALTVVSNTASTDASLSSIFTLTLTGNTTLATPTNGFSGQRIVYRLRQDGTGNKLLTLSSGFRSGPVTVTLSTAANTTDYLGVIYNEIDNEWDVLALNKGYS